MTENRLPLAELMAKAGDGDFLRSVAEAVVQLLMETDVDGLIGAGRHERTGDRTTYRNGYRRYTNDFQADPLHPSQIAATPDEERLPLSKALRLELWVVKGKKHDRRAGPLLLMALTGCTHVQLTASTVSTASTVMEIEYQMVMDNLARMERNPAALPSEIRIKQGTVQVSDELGLYQLQASGSPGGTFGGPRAERTVSEQWGADAISDPRAVKQLQDVYRAAMRLPPMPTPGFLVLDRAREAAQTLLQRRFKWGHPASRSDRRPAARRAP